MRASIRNQINPPTATSNRQDFSAAKVDEQAAKQINNDARTDFDEILSNSMDQIQQEREALKNGDLSSSSEAEFFQKLSEQTKEKNTKKNELQKDDFLKLFVAQLQHQDPLNPDDGAEMASKLAQFNSLEQMMNMNKNLDKMVASQTTDRNLQMINYVGKEVTVDGGRIKLDNQQITKSTYQIDRPAAQTTLQIRDSGGKVVFERDLGPMEKGEHDLNWDGRNGKEEALPQGVYTYNVVAKDLDNKNIPIAITSRVKITGVDIKSPEGDLFTDFGKVKLDEIKSLGEPGFDHKPNKPSIQEELSRRQVNGELGLKNGANQNAKESESFHKPSSTGTRIGQEQSVSDDSNLRDQTLTRLSTEDQNTVASNSEKIANKSDLIQVPEDLPPHLMQSNRSQVASENTGQL